MDDHTTDLERFENFFNAFGIQFRKVEYKNERTDLVLEDVNQGTAWAEFKFDKAERFDQSGVYAKMVQDGSGPKIDRSDTEMAQEMKRKWNAVQRKERLKKVGPPPISKTD